MNEITEIYLPKYSRESLIELKARIDDYIKKGYTKYEFTYSTGYYGDIEDPTIIVLK